MKVKDIINPEAKGGTNAKGQKWSTSQVELEDGTRAYIFNPINVGDEVESYNTKKDGVTYTNYRKVKPLSQEQQTIVAMLTEINKKIDRLLGDDLL